MTTLVGVLVAAERDRCGWSDLYVDECAHCCGDNGQAGLFFADAPPPKRTRVIRGIDLGSVARRATTPIARGTRCPALCVNEWCRPPRDNDPDPKPRSTDGRANLCPPCEDRMRADLLTIADAWLDLEARLSRVTAGGGDDDPVSGSPATGIVVDEAVSETIRETTGLLVDVAERVRDERAVAVPTIEPSGLARWLARSHVPWLAAHPDPDWTATLAADIGTTRRAVMRRAYPVGARRITLPTRCERLVHVGICPAHERGEEPCKDHAHWQQCGAGQSTLLIERSHTYPDLVCDTGDPGHNVPPSVWLGSAWRRRIDRGPALRLVRSIGGNAHQ